MHVPPGLQTEDALGVAKENLLVGCAAEFTFIRHLVKPCAQREDHVGIHHVRGEEEAVGVRFKEGKAERRFIKVSHAIGNDWYVTDGLKLGEKIILNGVNNVRAGALPCAAVVRGGLD